MSQQSTGAVIAANTRSVDYRMLSLVELVGQIARHADRLALRELHDGRTPCQSQGRAPMRLVDFMRMLGESGFALDLVGHDPMALERAVDLTLDRFTNLPTTTNDPRRPTEPKGPDCRNCFKSFLKQVDRWRTRNPNGGRLQEEIAAARILQKQVLRHFRLCCLEARRHCNPARFRYAWHVDSRVIYVWMPRHMPGRECRPWLRNNASHVDLAASDAARRVQSIVNSRLGVPRHVPLASRNDVPTRESRFPEPWEMERQVTVRGLAMTVADEKAANLHRQRPAIRTLGGPSLRVLILQIFEALSEGDYEEKRLAQAFGLSRATFSRFAGSRWRARPAAPPPDLWANVAQTLSGCAVFTKAAEDAGVWPRVEEALGRSHRGRTTDG